MAKLNAFIKRNFKLFLLPRSDHKLSEWGHKINSFPELNSNAHRHIYSLTPYRCTTMVSITIFTKIFGAAAVQRSSLLKIYLIIIIAFLIYLKRKLTWEWVSFLGNKNYKSNVLK